MATRRRISNIQTNLYGMCIESPRVFKYIVTFLSTRELTSLYEVSHAHQEDVVGYWRSVDSIDIIPPSSLFVHNVTHKSDYKKGNAIPIRSVTAMWSTLPAFCSGLPSSSSSSPPNLLDKERMSLFTLLESDRCKRLVHYSGDSTSTTPHMVNTLTKTQMETASLQTLTLGSVNDNDNDKNRDVNDAIRASECVADLLYSCKSSLVSLRLYGGWFALAYQHGQAGASLRRLHLRVAWPVVPDDITKWMKASPLLETFECVVTIQLVLLRDGMVWFPHCVFGAAPDSLQTLDIKFCKGNDSERNMGWSAYGVESAWRTYVYFNNSKEYCEKLQHRTLRHLSLIYNTENIKGERCDTPLNVSLPALERLYIRTSMHTESWVHALLDGVGDKLEELSIVKTFLYDDTVTVAPRKSGCFSRLRVLHIDDGDDSNLFMSLLPILSSDCSGGGGGGTTLLTNVNIRVENGQQRLVVVKWLAGLPNLRMLTFSYNDYGENVLSLKPLLLNLSCVESMSYVFVIPEMMTYVSIPMVKRLALCDESRLDNVLLFHRYYPQLESLTLKPWFCGDLAIRMSFAQQEEHRSVLHLDVELNGVHDMEWLCSVVRTFPRVQNLVLRLDSSHKSTVSSKTITPFDTLRNCLSGLSQLRTLTLFCDHIFITTTNEAIVLIESLPTLDWLRVASYAQEDVVSRLQTLEIRTERYFTTPSSFSSSYKKVLFMDPISWTGFSLK